MSSALKRIGFFKNRNKYVKAVQVPTATFSISESANETSATYTIDSNKPNITLYYSTGGSATPNDFTDNSLTGNIALDANGNASLVRTINSNNIGLARTFSTDVRINSTSGKIVYNGNTYNLLDNEMITPATNPNFHNRVVFANVTLGGVDYQQYQLMQDMNYPTTQPDLDSTTLPIFPGSGPVGEQVEVLVIGAGGSGGAATFGVTGGGGGGGGEIVQQSLTYDSGANAIINITVPKSSLINTDPANANTIISNLQSLSSSNPLSITALHGENGEDGSSSKGGDGGLAGNSNISGAPGTGAGGRTTNINAYPYGTGPSEGANGTFTSDFVNLIFRADLSGNATFSWEYDPNRDPGVTQKSTSGSGTGAKFTSRSQLEFYQGLSNLRQIPNANTNASSGYNFVAGLDPYAQTPQRISILGARDNIGGSLGNAGLGYNVGDTVVLDGADLNGETGTNDISITIDRVEPSNGAIRVWNITWPPSPDQNAMGIGNVIGVRPVVFHKDDFSDANTYYPNILAPYTMNDPATFNANTSFNFFGGGGGVSQTNLNGGIAYFGRGLPGQGGKGEHFRNTGANIDMYATGGAGGAVFIRWRRFAPFRTIQIS